MMTPSNKIPITNVVGHSYLIVCGIDSQCLYTGQKHQSYPKIKEVSPLLGWIPYAPDISSMLQTSVPRVLNPRGT
jgi:hypothetical protein